LPVEDETVLRLVVIILMDEDEAVMAIAMAAVAEEEEEEEMLDWLPTLLKMTTTRAWRVKAVAIQTPMVIILLVDGSVCPWIVVAEVVTEEDEAGVPLVGVDNTRV
jgi:hypothetical protein